MDLSDTFNQYVPGRLHGRRWKGIGYFDRPSDKYMTLRDKDEI